MATALLYHSSLANQTTAIYDNLFLAMSNLHSPYIQQHSFEEGQEAKTEPFGISFEPSATPFSVLHNV